MTACQPGHPWMLETGLPNRVSLRRLQAQHQAQALVSPRGHFSRFT